MLLDLKDIVFNDGKEYTASFPIEMKSFDSALGQFPVSTKTALQFNACNMDQKLKISGSAEMKFNVPCDRCLTDVPVLLQLSIAREFSIENKELVRDELDQSDYMIGFTLDTEKLIYDEILLNWPMKVLCKEDCKGICTKCGCNLNLKECDCDRTVLDPRMAAIQDIFNRKEV